MVNIASVQTIVDLHNVLYETGVGKWQVCWKPLSGSWCQGGWLKEYYISWIYISQHAVLPFQPESLWRILKDVSWSQYLWKVWKGRISCSKSPSIQDFSSTPTIWAVTNKSRCLHTKNLDLHPDIYRLIPCVFLMGFQTLYTLELKGRKLINLDKVCI